MGLHIHFLCAFFHATALSDNENFSLSIHLFSNAFLVNQFCSCTSGNQSLKYQQSRSFVGVPLLKIQNWELTLRFPQKCDNSDRFRNNARNETKLCVYFGFEIRLENLISIFTFILQLSRSLTIKLEYRIVNYQYSSFDFSTTSNIIFPLVFSLESLFTTILAKKIYSQKGPQVIPVSDPTCGKKGQNWPANIAH